MSQDNDEVVSDEQFYERADEFIHLANEFADSENLDSPLTPVVPGQVSASFMYANARYSVWLSACSYKSAEDFKKDKQVIHDYYLEQFKLMLEDNLEEYHENFETYFPQSDEDDIKPDNEVKRFV